MAYLMPGVEFPVKMLAQTACAIALVAVFIFPPFASSCRVTRFVTNAQPSEPRPLARSVKGEPGEIFVEKNGSLFRQRKRQSSRQRGTACVPALSRALSEIWSRTWPRPSSSGTAFSFDKEGDKARDKVIRRGFRQSNKPRVTRMASWRAVSNPCRSICALMSSCLIFPRAV
jgi:hypothetical protein